MWVYFGKSNRGNLCDQSLFRLVSSLNASLDGGCTVVMRSEVRSARSIEMLQWQLATLSGEPLYMTSSARRGWGNSSTTPASYFTLDGTEMVLSSRLLACRH